MSLIAIDIDGTLYDFNTPFRQAYLDIGLENGAKEQYFKGAFMSWVEWRSPSDVCGSPAFEEALRRVHSTEVILDQIPFGHASEVLWELVDDGHELFYISNRRDDTWEATNEWLRKNHFPFEDDLICTMDAKKPYVEQCQYIIDDRPKTLVEFVYDADWTGDQRKAFGLLFEHNRALTDIPNVYLAPTWGGLRYYLQEKGVLSGTTANS